MDNVEVLIEPITDIKTTIINKVVIFNVQVTLNDRARCQVNIYDSNNILKESRQVSLTEEQYSNWLEDDDYFVSCIIINLGYTRV